MPEPNNLLLIPELETTQKIIEVFRKHHRSDAEITAVLIGLPKLLRAAWRAADTQKVWLTRRRQFGPQIAQAERLHRRYVRFKEQLERLAAKSKALLSILEPDLSRDKTDELAAKLTGDQTGAGASRAAVMMVDRTVDHLWNLVCVRTQALKDDPEPKRGHPRILSEEVIITGLAWLFNAHRLPVATTQKSYYYKDGASLFVSVLRVLLPRTRFDHERLSRLTADARKVKARPKKPRP